MAGRSMPGESSGRSGNRHQCAGVAGGHGGLGSPSFTRLTATRIDEPFFYAAMRAQAARPSDDFGGRLDAQTLAEWRAQSQVRFDGRATDQHDAASRSAAQKIAGQPERHRRAVIAPCNQWRGDSHSAEKMEILVKRRDHPGASRRLARDLLALGLKQPSCHGEPAGGRHVVTWVPFASGRLDSQRGATNGATHTALGGTSCSVGQP